MNAFPFEVSAGTITGTAHTQPLLWRNNQDAYRVLSSDELLVAVACDGCSSAQFSEMGARIGANVVAKVLYEVFSSNLGMIANWPASEYGEKERLVHFFLETARVQTLKVISDTAKSMGGNFSETIESHFLFSTIGALLTRSDAYLFSIGDGVFVIDGEIISLEPCAGNTPPCLAYDLVKNSLDPKSYQAFGIIRSLPTSEFNSIVVGSDGVKDLIAGADKSLPGQKAQLGGIEQFWEQDRYFKNPDMIRRRLALANNATSSEKGLLADDTTLIVIRRKKLIKGGE